MSYVYIITYIIHETIDLRIIIKHFKVQFRCYPVQKHIIFIYMNKSLSHYNKKIYKNLC